MSAKPVIILYAEDDENDVFFMKRAFAKRQEAHRLKIVGNGRQAEDYLAGSGEFSDHDLHPRPHLVLLDLKMPGLSGLEVLSWMRAQTALGGLPAVIFTSSTQDLDIAMAREHGANGYLAKPSNAENFLVLVDELTAFAAAFAPGNVSKRELPGSRI